MKITIRELKMIVREAVVGGSNPAESYDKEFTDDPAFKKKSTYVPDDIKKKISKWSRNMGLSGVRKRKRAT